MTSLAAARLFLLLTNSPLINAMATAKRPIAILPDRTETNDAKGETFRLFLQVRNGNFCWLLLTTLRACDDDKEACDRDCVADDNDEGRPTDAADLEREKTERVTEEASSSISADDIIIFRLHFEDTEDNE